MQIHVYFEPWINGYVAFDADLQDVDYTGPVVWAKTKEEAVAELQELLKDESA